MQPKNLFLVINLVIFSASCSYLPEKGNINRPTIATAISSTTTFTYTITPSLTTSPISTKTFMPSNTPTSLHTYTPINIPPIQAIMDLYFTNGDCSYPCWWGISPGISTYQEVRLFENQYKPEIKLFSDGDAFLQLDWTEGNNYTNKLRYPDFSEYTLDDPYTDIVFQNDIVSLLHINTPNNKINDKPTYSNPNNILRNYGIPDEIYVGQPGFSEIAGALDLIIIYNNYHIMFNMTIGGRSLENGFYHFCGDSINDLWLWEANRELEKGIFMDYLDNFNPKLLSEVIPWDNATFTNKLSPYNQICIYFSYESLNNWWDE